MTKLNFNNNLDDKPFWKCIGGCMGPYDIGPEQIAGMLGLIADEIKWRGDKQLDLNPEETAEWLRQEAEQALYDVNR